MTSKDEHNRDEHDEQGAALTASDFKRIENVLKVTGRFSSRSTLDLKTWETHTKLHAALATAVGTPTIKEQRRILKGIVANCDTALSQYERRMKHAETSADMRELTLEKKLRVEALRFNVAKLYDNADGSPRKTAAVFQSFLMGEVLDEVEALSGQLDVKLRNIKLKTRMVKLMADDKRERAQGDLEMMKRTARELAADLLKKEITFSVGLEILGMLDAQVGEQLTRDTYNERGRGNTQDLDKKRNTGKLDR